MKVTSFPAHILLVPLIVASSISIPLAFSRAASSADITGSAVVVSIRISPSLPVSKSLRESSTTVFTTAEFGSDRMMTSTCGGMASGESAICPPRSARARILPGSASYPITGYPAASRFRAIPPPIRPRPTKPIFFFPIILSPHRLISLPRETRSGMGRVYEEGYPVSRPNGTLGRFAWRPASHPVARARYFLLDNHSFP